MQTFPTNLTPMKTSLHHDIYFHIILENDDYRIRIQYFNSDYEQQYKEQQFDTENIHITVMPKGQALPLEILLQTTTYPEFFGIKLQDALIPADKMTDLQSKLQAAHYALYETRNTLETYFPNVIDNLSKTKE